MSKSSLNKKLTLKTTGKWENQWEACATTNFTANPSIIVRAFIDYFTAIKRADRDEKQSIASCSRCFIRLQSKYVRATISLVFFSTLRNTTRRVFVTFNVSDAPTSPDRCLSCIGSRLCWEQGTVWAATRWEMPQDDVGFRVALFVSELFISFIQ